MPGCRSEAGGLFQILGPATEKLLSPSRVYVTLVYCGQTVGWIKMKLGVEVGLGPDHIVLDGDLYLPPERGTAAPSFRSMSIVVKRSPVSATAEHLLLLLPCRPICTENLVYLWSDRRDFNTGLNRRSGKC